MQSTDKSGQTPFIQLACEDHALTAAEGEAWQVARNRGLTPIGTLLVDFAYNHA
jgi:hypothetical protein